MVCTAYALNIHEYTSPVVTLKEGNARLLSGTFNLVHIVDLSKYDDILSKIRDELTNNANGSRRDVIEFHLSQAEQGVKELKGKRRLRSVDWIGSAWKWIAGSPDATDWSKILKSENDLVHNSNQQYRINRKLFNVTDRIIAKYNLLLDAIHNDVSDRTADRLESHILDKALILKEEVHELVRGCQMARKGIVNTNLLDALEIEQILNEEASLPYQNEIEALEYATPSVLVNSTTLLYVLSLPKVDDNIFNHIRVLPAIREGLQVDLKFGELLINQEHIFGIKEKCYAMRNYTICATIALEEVVNNGCLAGLLRGGEAHCTFKTNTKEVVSLINEDTIFVTNFQGPIECSGRTRNLNGTYIIKIYNETVVIRGMSYVSRVSTAVQILPSVVTKVTNNQTKIDVEYLHALHIENTEQLQQLEEKSGLLMMTDFLTLFLIIFLVAVVWRYVSSRLRIPKENLAALQAKSPPNADLRDADI